MKHRLLAVDDQESFLSAIKIGLSEEFEVLTSTNGKQALEIVRSERPAVVLLDVVLSDENGVDICKEMRADPKIRDIPVLMLSGFDDMDKRIDAYMSGVDD